MKLSVALPTAVEEQLAQAAERLNVSPDELAAAASLTKRCFDHVNGRRSMGLRGANTSTE